MNSILGEFSDQHPRTGRHRTERYGRSPGGEAESAVLQRARARVDGLAERIVGSDYHSLMNEYGIRTHPGWSGEDIPMVYDAPDEETRLVDAHVVLHTIQDYLYRPALEKYILDPYVYDPTHFDRESHDRRVWVWRYDGQLWLTEGHHRILADRMTGRRGVISGYRDLDREAEEFRLWQLGCGR
jgi:hypothetical protein